MGPCGNAHRIHSQYFMLTPTKGLYQNCVRIATFEFLALFGTCTLMFDLVVFEVILGSCGASVSKWPITRTRLVIE